MVSDIKCPRCDAEAIYKFGKTKTGKQRYICQVCNRQFVPGKSRLEATKRPRCPSCGKLMHIFMRGDSFIRFRCSDYPKCRTFHKLTKEDALFGQLLHR
jgi:DNA-directed RNA polymerase subunit RPC12/RpoP